MPLKVITFSGIYLAAITVATKETLEICYPTHFAAFVIAGENAIIAGKGCSSGNYNER